MKHDCEVVRDLMPMVVDGTASDKSRAMVDEHVEECEPCREMLGEMRQEISKEAERQQDVKLVRKLRRHRLVRRALVVLLSVTACLVLAILGKQTWDYYYDVFCVATKSTDYTVETVPHGASGVQFIMTATNGNAQKLNSYLDEETGDLYLWSLTTRKPRSSGSVYYVVTPGNFYFRQGLGFASIDHEWDGYGHVINTTVSTIQRIYKGPPLGVYPGNVVPELMYEAEQVDEELLSAWFEEIEQLDAAKFPRDTSMDWLRQQALATGTDL